MRAPLKRAMLVQARVFATTAYRDPSHLPERIVLLAMDRLGEPSAKWATTTLAQRPDATPAQLAEERRKLTARVAMVDGAIAGTPFFVALLPGYLDFLWQELSMVLRIAALYGRDPRELHTAAEFLALRGIHPSVEAAKAALQHVQATPMPSKPEHRRPLRNWLRAVQMIAVLGGFLDPPDDPGTPPKHGKILSMLALIVSIGLWIVTWVLPLTFMVMMAWGCEGNARKLGKRAEAYYGSEANSIGGAINAAEGTFTRGHRLRQLTRAAILLLTVALPIAFVAYAVHVRSVTGGSPLTAIAALVALAVVIATAVVARRA